MNLAPRGSIKAWLSNLVGKGIVKPVRYVEMEDSGQRAGVYVETELGKEVAI